ncbi:ABC transporter permease [Helcococcus kunzii]|uniref:ABC transporter permease n=1 Tax=Helcococcus kunzii TaxID=40091 RepID=UPI001C95FB34|nr:ABC transporter permease [Helcococcus kunzii]QZO76827.1 ABC transporter permease [Helcococcus kunzii]
MNRLYKEKNSLYGKFIQIKYLDDSKNIGKENFDRFNYGLVEISEININDKSYNLGALNDKILENELSKKDIKKGEVIITKSFANNNNLSLNQRLSLYNRDFIIKDVISDYSNYWIKGDFEQINNTTPPELLLNYEDYLEVVKDNSLKVSSIYTLYENDDVDLWRNLKGKEYLNTLTYGNKFDLYEFPNLYQNVMIALYAVITFIFLYTYKNYTNKRYHVYKILGMHKFSRKQLLIKEILFISFIVLTLGILLSLLIVSLLFTVINKELIFVYNKDYVFQLIKYVLIHLLISMIFVLFIFGTKEKRNVLKNKFEKILIPVLAGIFCIVLTYIHSNMVMYFDNTLSNLNSSNALGKMDNDYDFELELLRLNPNEKVYYNNDFHKKSGEAIDIKYFDKNKEFNKLISEIKRKSKDIKIRTYSTVYSAYIKDKGYINQEYIIKGYPMNISYNTEYWKGITDKDLLKSEIFTYPDSDLKEISKKINLNETDEIKLLNGEGVVVVKQPFKFLETKLKDENGEENIYRLQTVPAEYNDKDAVKDDTVKKGSILDLFVLDAKSTAYGLFDRENMLKAFNIKNVQLNVIGTSDKYIAWFNPSENNNPYRMIASDKLLEKKGINNTISRIRINIKDDYLNTKNLITSLLTNYDQIILNDNYEIQQQIKDFKILTIGFNILLLVSIIISMIFILYTFLSSYYKLNKNTYEIYLLLGMKKRKLLFVVIIPFIISCVLSTIINLIISFKQSGDAFFMTKSEMISVLRISLLPSLIYLTILLVINILINREFVKNTYNNYIL